GHPRADGVGVGELSVVVVDQSLGGERGHHRIDVKGVNRVDITLRGLRELGMPIADVRAVLASAPAARNALISGHLERLQNQLAATRSAVETLRAILERPVAASRIEHRSVAATPAAAIAATVERDDLLPWWQGAVGELQATVAAEKLLTPTGVPAAL